MESYKKQIEQLHQKLDALHNKQRFFNDEIVRLRFQIDKLQQETAPILEKVIEEPITLVSEEPINKEVEKIFNERITSPISNTNNNPKPSKPNFDIKENLERFIGEKLINIIGILILILGVGIGVKYAIDNNIITPTARIILGYVVSFGLLAFAYKLKEKYNSFSAVLLSGAMASLYFVSYVAYSMYGLFPQLFTFVLMFVLTVFTVIAALVYKQQIIALLGLVGAYAVPFLLSTGSGNVLVLFSYMTLVNMGILFIAFKQNWKPLYYTAYVFTWLIFLSWYNSGYESDQHFKIAIGFSLVFYLLFYVIFLAYKLVKKKSYSKSDIILLLSNSFVYFGIGYFLLERDYDSYLGLFTVFNAVLNFIVAKIIYTKKLGDKNLFYLVIGLVMTFITIAIPIQLEGNWITLVWLAEAVLLFWLGTKQQINVYIKLAYPIILLAFFGLVIDWEQVPRYNLYDSYPVKTPLFFHINFLTSVLAIVAFGYLNYLRFFAKIKTQFDTSKFLTRIFTFIIPLLFLFVFYSTFELEITRYWQQKFVDSQTGEPNFISDFSLPLFKNIWLVNYTLAFFAALFLGAIKYLSNKKLQQIATVLLSLAVFLFLMANLYSISELRENYISQINVERYYRGSYHLIIRYISFVFLALAVYILKWGKLFTPKKYKIKYELFVYFVVLWVLSSELIHLLELQGVEGTYKYGLSILWGVYALMFVSLGILKHKKHLRFSGISLFGVTLLKLFFYDIAHMNTITKTIIFVILGILLLLISFLYNKYNTKIFEEEEHDAGE